MCAADPGGTPATDQVELLTREFDFHSLVRLRHEVENCAAAAGMDDRTRYLFIVAVNEVTTNAVRHGGGTGHMRLWREDHRLHCRVTDRGPGIPLDRYGERRPAPDTLGGRGLWLARQGCETLTVDTGTGGSTVTLTQRISPVAVPAREC
jgi:anti-sigma regulatory factor (Ser/Thr protein kinase)